MARTPEQWFGAAVRQAREQRGLSQSALAETFAAEGIPVGGQSGVARIEAAERPTRFNEIVGIARLLSLDLAEALALDVKIPGPVEGLLGEIRDLLTELVIPVRAEQQMLQRLAGRLGTDGGDAR